MIATILALPASGESARTVAWRQLVDIVAQAGGRLDPATCVAAHERIAELGPGVSAAERRSAAASLAARAGPQAVAIFAADAPAIAAPVLSRAQLADGEWLAIIPTLPPPSRTILRNRRDLSPAVERALASYGASDFALPSAEVPVDPTSQIRNLVERIETFRRQQPPVLPRTLSGDEPEFQVMADAETPAATFVFETDADGAMDWIEGVPRTALIGISIADAAPPRAAGVDGQAAGAFRRRAPFRDARLVVAGEGAAGGDWLIMAQPVFNPRDGRFAGYHGTARRPRPDERARRFGEADTVPLAADSLRQLVHELRTPLNAIQGFAEMIDQQMLGPAASAYRVHARSIYGESRRLLEVVEDIDTAARIDGDRLEPTRTADSNASAILARVLAELRPSLGERGIAIDAMVSDNVEVAVGDVQIERLAQRLLAMVTGVAARGETIAVTLDETATAATLSVARARALAGVDERQLLDPGFGPDGEWPSAPLLGLGFSLRLIGNLARAVRGSLDIGTDAFVLTLPRPIAQAGRAGEIV
jgi:signal transduction histidine kinase